MYSDDALAEALVWLKSRPEIGGPDVYAIRTGVNTLEHSSREELARILVHATEFYSQASREIMSPGCNNTRLQVLANNLETQQRAIEWWERHCTNDERATVSLIAWTVANMTTALSKAQGIY